VKKASGEQFQTTYSGELGAYIGRQIERHEGLFPVAFMIN